MNKTEQSPQLAEIIQEARDAQFAASRDAEADEDAFNDWNRDIDGYEPTLWDAYLFGLKRGSNKRISELEEHAQSVRHSRDYWADRAKATERALEEIVAESNGALNNAFPEDAPNILEHMGIVAKRALATVQHHSQ